jgi:hypothetical protein
MIHNGSCTIKRGKEKKLQNEVNKIYMVQGIKRPLDGEKI